MNYLPSKLLKLRKHYNYSQAHVADVLGVDAVEYMAYENGRKVLNYNQCKKIASLYHVGTIDIFRNSDEVILYEVAKAKTDELNIEYFLPKKTLKDKLSIFIRRHGVLIGVTLGVVILGIIALFLFNKPEEIPYEPTLSYYNCLSVSNTTVVYISKDGAVKGSGDNSNGQLSNLPSSGAIKVAEGSSFTVILHNDGSVESIGLLSKYSEELNKWKNIVDIAAGDNHVVGVDNQGNVFAVGDNTYGQCEIKSFKDINKVYASNKATIVSDNNGKLYYSGEFVGSSQLKNYENILDFDASNDNLVLLTSDHRVEYIAKSKNFLNIYKWRNVAQIACGNEFVGALMDDGTVQIDCDDQDMINEVAKWKDIVAIDAGDNYLIAYDGEKIHGVGQNDYHQFEQNVIEKTTLPQTSGVKIAISNTVDVSFDKVVNAEGYEIKLDIDEPIVYKVSSNQTVSFGTDRLEDGMSYRIVITTLGDGEKYQNSYPLEVHFTYQKEKDISDEYVDINMEFEGMPVVFFVNYVKGIGVPSENIIGIETSEPCKNNVETIVSVNGISSGQRILRGDLNNTQITYNYCRIDQEVIEENNNEQDMEN